MTTSCNCNHAHKGEFARLIRYRWVLALAVAASLAALRPYVAEATGVPVGGFLPFVGIGLTDEFKDSGSIDWDFFVEASSSPGGSPLGTDGSPYYDLALLDTGAAVSLITDAADDNFGIGLPRPGESDGFRGTEVITIGGATGQFEALISDPLGLYVGGLQSRSSTDPLIMDPAGLSGQTNTSIITIPPESDLPNVVGLTFASQYSTYIRNDRPQIFQLHGQTVRTPHVEFLPLGSDGEGITRRAPMPLKPAASFSTLPFYFFNFNGGLDEFHEDPAQPTVIQGGLFLNTDIENKGERLENFELFFDTGADVTVLSELNASRLGFDAVLDDPEFTVAVVGSGGARLEVPGFFVEEFTIEALGGNLTATNVPVIVLNVTDPSDPGNIVDGIVGTNLLAGRNVVIDPDPSLGGGNPGPQLFISDPVTTQSDWTSAAVAGSFNSSGNWSAGAPEVLAVSNARHVAGGDQTADVVADQTVWELNVSGSAPDQRMTVAVQDGVTLTTFAGANVEQHGVLKLENGVLDVHFVDVRQGTLTGEGEIWTGSGDIDGQVENIGGVVAPGNGVGVLEIEGRLSNGVSGTLAIELGGVAAGVGYDQILVDGPLTLDGHLEVKLVDLGGGLFEPNIGDLFSIIESTQTRVGEFEFVDLPSLPDDLFWHLQYKFNGVELLVAAAGDFNVDGSVDGGDLNAWESEFGPTYGGSHFLQWQRNLGAGVEAAANVPEPAALSLAILSASLLLMRRATRRNARS